MALMNAVMVDTETTHTDPDAGGIIQLSAIKFNLETLELGDHFDRCPAILPRRVWSESTKEFWQVKNRPHWLKIVEREEDPLPVYRDFSDWLRADAPDGGFTFWAKPVKFDWPFIESQYLQLGLAMPFAHWNQMDLHSYIAGLRGDVRRTDIEKELPFNGVKHNSLHDVAWQLDLLFHAKRGHVHAEVVA